VKMSSIRSHLRPYSIAGRRLTTINHAFASAIAPCETYDSDRVAQSIRDLGQNPKKELKCVYCGRPAKTWDHVYGLVKDRQYSGYGHTLGNLVPCCPQCNERKGGKEWSEFLRTTTRDKSKLKRKMAELESYFKKHPAKSISLQQIQRLCPKEMRRLMTQQRKIRTSMEEADRIVKEIREKVRSRQS